MMQTELHAEADAMQMQAARDMLARAQSLAYVLAQGFQTAADHPECEFALVTDRHKARAIEGLGDLIATAQRALGDV